MNVFKRKITAIVSVVLAAAVICASVILLGGSDRTADGTLPDLSAVIDQMAAGSDSGDYDSYMLSHGDVEKIGGETVLPLTVTVKEGEDYTLEVSAQSTYIANIQLTYRIISDNNGDGVCSVNINGELPFREANEIKLHRQWSALEPSTDSRGNQCSVVLQESEEYNTEILTDSSGFHSEPLYFCFAEGKNSLTIRSAKGDIELYEIRLFARSAARPYEEVSAGYADKDINISADPITVQGELPYLRTNASITEACDRTSPVTEPVFDGIQVWNSIGGSGWNTVGQAATWKITVKQSGCYSLAFRYKNNFVSGLSTYRKLLIDGQVPFSEMEAVQFQYGPDWQVMQPSDENGDPYLYYLTEGEHTITLQVTLGDQAYLLNSAQKSLIRLNEAYRKIIMVTGATPDTYRDYQIEENLPEVLQIFREQKEVLSDLARWLIIKNGGEGEGSAKIEELIRRLEDFLEYPESVPQYLSTYLSNLTGLSDWIQSNITQPLTIDFISVLSTGSELPKAKASFFENAVFGTKLFIKSFAEDYGVIGNIYEDGEAVEVWITLGRDQYQIMKEQIDSYFTQQYGIGVNLKLVAGGVLEATVAGIGPDVYLFADETMPMNFAARGALKDLTDYPDFESVTTRFAPETLVPYSYDGGVYALPITQDFDVMFVRNDILEEIGLAVPQTWDDIYNCLTILQQNNMEFAYPGSGTLSGLALILFQKQDHIYKDGGKAIDFDNEIAIEAFDKWTKLYSDYSLLMTYSFVNRFRTGDMPIGIAPFSIFNTLEVSAPEISGLWSMYQVPGSVSEDGTVRHISLNSSLAAIIMKNAELEDESWEFVKWFTSEEQQYRYATAIENRQGISGRFSTANIKAFNRLSWDSDALKTLNLQRENAISIEQVPGGYFTSRHINNIFRKIIDHDADVRETVSEYTKMINDEITKKRKEFGLEADS